MLSSRPTRLFFLLLAAFGGAPALAAPELRDTIASVYFLPDIYIFDLMRLPA